MDINIHHYIHMVNDERFEQILRELHTLKQQGEKLMASSDEAKAISQQILDATNELATVVDSVVAQDAAEDAAYEQTIQNLKDKVASGEAIVAADLAAFDEIAASGSQSKDKLQQLSAFLKSMGTNPDAPIPPVVVDPLPPVDDTGGGTDTGGASPSSRR